MSIALQKILTANNPELGSILRIISRVSEISWVTLALGRALFLRSKNRTSEE
jgi:hypothetical protein